MTTPPTRDEIIESHDAWMHRAKAAERTLREALEWFESHDGHAFDWGELEITKAIRATLGESA